jgi:hypothetical protein
MGSGDTSPAGWRGSAPLSLSSVKYQKYPLSNPRKPLTFHAGSEKTTQCLFSAVRSTGNSHVSIIFTIRYFSNVTLRTEASLGVDLGKQIRNDPKHAICLHRRIRMDRFTDKAIVLRQLSSVFSLLCVAQETAKYYSFSTTV